MRHYTKLGARGQMVVPAAVRKELGLTPGQKLRVEVKDGKLTVTPVPEDLIDRLMGCLAEGPELLEELRREHLEEIEREEAYLASLDETRPGSLSCLKSLRKAVAPQTKAVAR